MTEMPCVVLLMQPFAGYDRGLLEGIARYTQLHGPWLFHLPAYHPGVPMPESDSIGAEMTRTVQTLSSSLPLRRLGVSGIIGRIQSPAIARKLLASHRPVIAIELTKKQLSRDSLLQENVSEIRADSHRAGWIAAEHLLDRGFTTFGFCGYRGRIWSERRQEGYVERLQKNQRTCQIYEPPHRKPSLLWYQEQPLMVAWLRSLPKPVGIMACNDIRGHQVIDACLQAGLRVPDDVAVVGVDEDRLLCDLTTPPLSSVVLNLERAGYQAAELLDGLMSGRVKGPQRIMVDALRVVSRRSTDVMALDDQDVATAVRFIRDHFRDSITVDDVVEQVHLSRRGLEIRFQHSLGRSIRNEIQRMRLAWSKQLAVETNFSMAKIAKLSGFNSLSYMGSAFRLEYGLSLSECRRESRNP